MLSGLCVHVQLLRSKRIVCTNMASWFIQRLSDSFDVEMIYAWGLLIRLTQQWSMFEVFQFVWCSNDMCLRFVDLFDVAMICAWGFLIRLTFVRPSWLGTRRIRPKDVIFRVLFTTIWKFWLDPIVGPSSGFRRDLILKFFKWFTVQLLPLTVYLMSNTITWCNNIPLHYALCLCS